MLTNVLLTEIVELTVDQISVQVSFWLKGISKECQFMEFTAFDKDFYGFDKPISNPHGSHSES